MKYQSLTIFLLFLGISCSSDCNDDGDNGIDFDIKFNISSTNGENLFLNVSFDIKKLVIRPIGETSTNSFRFRKISENGIAIIEYGAFSENEIEFLYDGEQKIIISLTNKEFDTVDCNLIAKSFAVSNNEQLLCNCDINDIIPIEFDI